MFYRILIILFMVSGLCHADEIWIPYINGQTFYTFNITTPGSYVIWGRVHAPDSSSDSLYIMVNGDYSRVWDLKHTVEWDWDQANERDVADPSIFSLHSGSNSVSISIRENGSNISDFIVTNNLQFIPKTWIITLGFKHDDPASVDFYNMYCKKPNQTWSQGYKWRIENTSINPAEEITFTTPLLPADIFYCFAVSAVSHSGAESSLPSTPNAYDTCWACMYVKDFSFKE